MSETELSYFSWTARMDHYSRESYDYRSFVWHRGRQTTDRCCTEVDVKIVCYLCHLLSFIWSQHSENFWYSLLMVTFDLWWWWVKCSCLIGNCMRPFNPRQFYDVYRMTCHITVTIVYLFLLRVFISMLLFMVHQLLNVTANDPSSALGFIVTLGIQWGGPGYGVMAWVVSGLHSHIRYPVRRAWVWCDVSGLHSHIRY